MTVNVCARIHMCKCICVFVCGLSVYVCVCVCVCVCMRVLYNLLASQHERGTRTEMFY